MRSSKGETRPASRVTPIHALFAAAMLGLLVMPLALARAKPSEATSSARPAKQIKSLKRRVAALEARQSPAALPPNGPAGGDLIGSYPNPQIGPGAIQGAEFGRVISLQSDAAPVAPGERGGISVTCPAGAHLLSGGFEWGNPDGAGMRTLNSGTVVPDGVNPNLDPNNNPVWGVVARVDAGGTANTIRAKALCLLP
jgi:hypothetical protein